MVCIGQDLKNESECKTFKTYASLFKNNKMDYTFQKNGKNITVPDGSSHTLWVVVKDTIGATSSKSATYNIHKNTAPEISTAYFVPKYIGNKIALTAGLQISINDDVSKSKDIKLELYDVNTKTAINETYADYINSSREYTFSGKYDGIKRVLRITATDEFGDSSTKTIELDNILKYEGPVISNVIIESDGEPCTGSRSCNATSGNGGSVKTKINLSISDPLIDVKDYGEKIKICISENKNDCTSKNSKNFKLFKDMNGSSYTFEKSVTLPYTNPQKTKTIYVAAYEPTYNIYSPVVATNYILYHNFEPVIGGKISITSKSSNSSILWK